MDSSARRALSKVPEKVGTAAIEFSYGPPAANPYRIGKQLTLGLDTFSPRLRHLL